MSKYQGWKAFEREKVKRLKKVGWGDAKRNWSSQFSKKDKRDILNTQPWCFQLKYGKRPNLIKAHEEAKEATKKGEVPVGVIRVKGTKKTLVCLSWRDFEWLIK